MDLPMSLIMSALGEAANCKQGGTDHTVVEMWRGLSLAAKVRMGQQFRHYVNGAEHDRPESWTLLDMSSLAKEPGAQTLDKFRRIALSSVLLKWFLRTCVLLCTRSEPQRAPRQVLTWGYVKGRTVAAVVFAVRESLWVARTWGAHA